MSILDIDGKLFNFLNKAIEAVCLSVLWLLTSIPILTAGAATAALYYAVRKGILEDYGKIYSIFWKAFRENFKQATFAWILILLLIGIWCADGLISRWVFGAGTAASGLPIVFCVLIAATIMWAQYLLPYIASFRDPMKAVLRNSFQICVANPLWSALLLGVWIAAAAVVLYAPVLILCMPAGYMLFVNSILCRIFNKYLP